MSRVRDGGVRRLDGGGCRPRHLGRGASGSDLAVAGCARHRTGRARRPRSRWRRRPDRRRPPPRSLRRTRADQCDRLRLLADPEREGDASCGTGGGAPARPALPADARCVHGHRARRPSRRPRLRRTALGALRSPRRRRTVRPADPIGADLGHREHRRAVADARHPGARGVGRRRPVPEDRVRRAVRPRPRCTADADRGAKHFVPEDHPEPVAAAINELVATAGGGTVA